MTTDYQSRVEELLTQAQLLPDGLSKLALLEEAVRSADIHQNVQLGDALREALIRTAIFSGYPEKGLVAFSWRLAQSDRDGDSFPERPLMWTYKWIVDALPGFPQITLEQIEIAFDDMTRRFERCGFGLSAVYKLRWILALEMNEPDKARQYYRRWEKTPGDGNSDCRACDQDHRVLYHMFFNKREKAMQYAEPILRGSLSCATVPHRTYRRVLLPLLQLGQVEKAAEYHQTGYRRIRNNRQFLSSLGDHLIFLALTDNLSHGVKLFEKHLEWALESKCLVNSWSFYLGVRFLLSRLADSEKTALKLRLPKATPGYQEDGRYEVSVLASWVEEMCRDLAARFDARNGNDGFVRSLIEQHQLNRWRTPYPLGRTSG